MAKQGQITERVTIALQEQAGDREGSPVVGPQPLGPAGGMQRVAIEQQAGGRQTVRNGQARDAAAVGLAAEDPTPPGREPDLGRPGNGRKPVSGEVGARRGAPAGLAVRQVEADGEVAEIRQDLAEGNEPGRVERAARTVGEQERRPARSAGSVHDRADRATGPVVKSQGMRGHAVLSVAWLANLGSPATRSRLVRYPERFLTDDESIVAELHPHWRTLLIVALWTVVASALLWVAFANVDGGAMWALAGLVVLLWAVLSVPPIVNRKFVVYALTTERIVVRTGILSKSSVEIPLESIHDVRFEQNVIERLLGYGDVLLESAGERGQSLLTDVPDPEAFQSMVYGTREQRVLQLEGGSPRDAAAQLKDLADLRDRGDLTQAQFEEQKRRLLGG